MKVPVGLDGEPPVVESYGIPAPYTFTGIINKVTIALQEMPSSDKVLAVKGQAQAVMQKAFIPRPWNIPGPLLILDEWNETCQLGRLTRIMR